VDDAYYVFRVTNVNNVLLLFGVVTEKSKKWFVAHARNTMTKVRERELEKNIMGVDRKVGQQGGGCRQNLCMNEWKRGVSQDIQYKIRRERIRKTNCVYAAR